MKIGKDTVVTMDYELRLDGEDEVIDESHDGSFQFLVGYENIVPGLEKELLGLEQGGEKQVAVAPVDGYGTRDASKVFAVPRSIFPDDFHMEVGIPVDLEDEDGGSHLVWIAGVKGDDVIMDPNHPLADKTLNFKVKIQSVRQATRDELTHGHVHGPGGHHH